MMYTNASYTTDGEYVQYTILFYANSLCTGDTVGDPQVFNSIVNTTFSTDYCDTEFGGIQEVSIVSQSDYYSTIAEVPSGEVRPMSG